MCRQQAGDPKSRDPSKSVLKLPCLMLVLQKWMTYIVLLILSCFSFEKQVGRTSKYLKSFSLNKSRGIYFADLN